MISDATIALLVLFAAPVFLAALALFLVRGGLGRGGWAALGALAGAVGIVFLLGGGASAWTWWELTENIIPSCETEQRLNIGKKLLDCDSEGLIIVLPVTVTVAALALVMLFGLGAALFHRREGAPD